MSVRQRSAYASWRYLVLHFSGGIVLLASGIILLVFDGHPDIGIVLIGAGTAELTGKGIALR